MAEKPHFILNGHVGWIATTLQIIGPVKKMQSKL